MPSRHSSPCFCASIEARQLGASGRFETGRLRQRPEKVLIALTGVPSHDSAQCRIRFHGCRVNADRRAFHQPSRTESLEHPRKYGAVPFEIDEPARSRNR